MKDVTRILNAIEQGNPPKQDELLPLVYEELRVLARQRLANEKPGQTLQATALVHEAYLRLAGDGDRCWRSRGHFFGAAAEAMRRILIDNARRRKRPKHGGDRRRVDLDDQVPMTDDRAHELIALDRSLAKLADESPIKAELVKLRYFAGLTHQEASQVLGISRATADRYWAYAKTFLYCEMEGEQRKKQEDGLRRNR
jgi:RNA polymerase sigma factor (TIGR02999 family)